MNRSLVAHPKDIELARTAAECVVKVHQELTSFLKTGLTLPEIDAFVGKTLKSLNCKSAFFKYSIPGQSPFPSQSCLSVNECIVHGTHVMEQTPLKPGDLVSIDIGSKYKGWIGDAAWTWAIEYACDENMRLMEAGRKSLSSGIEAMQPGRPLIDFARAVQQVAECDYPFHLVRGLGGHGYGKTLHCPPYISNAVPSHPAEWPDALKLFEEGMLLAVEPMLTVGTPEIKQSRGAWPIYSADNSMSVHYEADILITKEGHINFTKELETLPYVIGTP